MYPSSSSASEPTHFLLPPTKNILTTSSRTGLVQSMRKVRWVLGETPILLERDIASTGATRIVHKSPRLILDSSCTDSPVIFASPEGSSGRWRWKSLKNIETNSSESREVRRRRRECSILGTSAFPVTQADVDRAHKTSLPQPIKLDPTSAEKPLPLPPLSQGQPGRSYAAIHGPPSSDPVDKNGSPARSEFQTSQRPGTAVPCSSRKPRPAPLILARNVPPSPPYEIEGSYVNLARSVVHPPCHTPALLSAKSSTNMPPLPHTPLSGSSTRSTPHSPLSPRSPRYTYGYRKSRRPRETTPTAAARRRKMNKIVRTLGHPVPVELVFSPPSHIRVQSKTSPISRSKQALPRNSRKIFSRPLPPLPIPKMPFPAPSESPLSVNVVVSITHDVSSNFLTLPTRRRAHSSASYLGDEKLPSSPPPFVDITGSSPSWSHKMAHASSAPPVSYTPILGSPLARTHTPMVWRSEEVKSRVFHKGQITWSGNWDYEDTESIRKSLRGLPRV